MILDWIVCLVCGGGGLYCFLTMPEKMIMRKEIKPRVESEQLEEKSA